MREGLNGARNSIVSSRAAIANAHEAMRQTQLRMASARERVAGTRLGQLPESRGIEQLFLSVITASAPLVGEAYFEKIPKIIADAWGGAAFLTRLDRAGSCRFLGITGLEEREPPANLTGQPWLGDGTSAAIYYPLNAGASFPDDPLLAGVETYLAVPLFDAAGTRVGYVGILDTRRWAAGEAAAAESLLRLVAPRAAAEVEREELHDRLSIELRNFAELATETGDGFVSWIAGETPRSVYVNRSALRMLGCEERDVTSDPRVLSRIVAAASEGDEGANRRTGVLLVRRSDGRDVAVDVRLTIDAEYAGGPMYRCILRETADARASSSEDVMLAAVLRKLPFAAIVIQDDDVVFMNARAAEVTGSTAAELLDRPVVLTDHRHQFSLTFREFARRALTSASTAPVSKYTITLKPRRGTERFFEVRTNAIVIGERTALILAPLDITREHSVQNRLLARADLSTRILASLPVDVIVIDGAGRVVALSDPANGFAQRTRERARCRPPLEIGDDYVAICRERATRDDEVARQSLHGVGSVLSGSIPHFVIQYESADPEGHNHTVLMSATPLNGGGAIITHSNITGLRQNELRLADEEARQRELLRHQPDQLARASSDGRIVEVWMPAQASRMVAPLPRAPMSRSVAELLPEPAAERLMKAIRDALQSNAVASCLVTLPYEDDEREYEMRVVPLPAHDVLLYVRDRTADQWTAAPAIDEQDAGQRQRIVRENPYGLTFREVAVLELMAQGSADKEIAAALGVSVFTIYKHVSKILHKMNAASRTEASLRTVREHLFG
jgi:PAS domain S-box-containing protein